MFNRTAALLFLCAGLVTNTALWRQQASVQEPAGRLERPRPVDSRTGVWSWWLPEQRSDDGRLESRNDVNVRISN
jgi:hypothetical protein